MVSIHWGVDGINKEEIGYWDGTSSGELIWDDNFKISSVENQQALLDLCQELKENEDLVKDANVKCWIQDLLGFYELKSLRETGEIGEFPIDDPQTFLYWVQRFLEEDVKGMMYKGD